MHPAGACITGIRRYAQKRKTPYVFPIIAATRERAYAQYQNAATITTSCEKTANCCGGPHIRPTFRATPGRHGPQLRHSAVGDQRRTGHRSQATTQIYLASLAGLRHRQANRKIIFSLNRPENGSL
ncbi:MAG: hypothetical protein ACLUEV_00480 [Alistipes sp.]